MNKKNLVRFFGVTLVILFLCIYIGQASGYYEYSNFKRTSLTNDAITKFEDDVKKGKNITMLTLNKLCNILECTPNDIVSFK